LKHIILKARRQRLLELEKSKTNSESELSKLAVTAFESYAKGNLTELLKTPDGSELSPDNCTERRDAAYCKILAGGTFSGEGKPDDAEAKMKTHLSIRTAATEAIKVNKIFSAADEMLLPYWDSLYKESIDREDYTILTDVTNYLEGEFMGDALNVMRADIMTRLIHRILNFRLTLSSRHIHYLVHNSRYPLM
jgi:cysteinyl-tRNA synthetase